MIELGSNIAILKKGEIEEHDKEGRVITLEFEKFYMVNCYTPNSKRELERLEYRQKWEDDFRKYLIELDKNKPIILCGDLNVAHNEIDLKNPKTNIHNAGFTIEERNGDNTVIIVTHNSLFADIADTVVRVKNGKIESVTANPNPKKIDEVKW